MSTQNDSVYSKYVLFILLVVYIANQWARFLLDYLYAVPEDEIPLDEDIEKISIQYATELTPTQYGFLAGYGFSFVFVISGLFMGRAADLYNRKLIVFLGLAIWNAGVFIQGLSQNYQQLLLSRVILGVGESFSSPASYSLIADYFPKERLATANGIFAWGVYLGGGLSSLSITMAESIGWRSTTFLVAMVGFVLAAVFVLTVQEPTRHDVPNDTPKEESLSMIESFKKVLSNRLIITLLAAGTMRYIGGNAISAYLPVYFDAAFPEQSKAYSYINASVVAFGGALSSYMGGWIADRWEMSGGRHARVWVPALGSLLACPFVVLTMAASNFHVAMMGLYFEFLFAECWFGPTMSVIQSTLPPRLFATGVSVFACLSTFMGSLATWVMGAYLASAESRGYGAGQAEDHHHHQQQRAEARVGAAGPEVLQRGAAAAPTGQENGAAAELPD
uniref:Major facilitator superfamily (MFS) profile domain-containing protein n=1 Tax=Fibrocapsa japonica TaxID=94617 RepID=A0A7S2Y1D3_9STRA|mmetsp:Transcript_7559/g.11484  ORF Transcript_7559/g.11484 Transcript_7559/m.11484 type:complete len:448 (+) Transcript_7559:107-1450(+)